MATKGDGHAFTKTDELAVNTIRFLAVDGVEKANSGHPGMPMGDAPMAHVLWSRYLRHNPKNPLWPARDRFILSAGHGSMLLYSLLHLSGYHMTIEDLKNFRQWGSRTPGHPEYDPELGVETTTGPLGQGFANGVGMAMAAKYLADRYNKPGYALFDSRVYAITGDGDMMEGVTNEAASTAGHLKLGNIVYLYSDNKITIEGSTDIAFTEDVGKRFEALNWHVQKVDGYDLAAISRAIEAAIAEKERPSLIIVRTHIGYGSPNKQNSHEAHGAPLGKDEVRATKTKLGWPLEPDFHVPAESAKLYAESAEKGAALEAKWNESLLGYEKEYPQLASELKELMQGRFKSDWVSALPKFEPKDGQIATRSASGKVLNAIASKTPYLIGGSADLSPSTNTHLKGEKEFMPTGSGRNVHFGVREHAMGSIMNGMAASGMLVPYGATFLVFYDYMRPPVRLASLMGLHCVYVFTHDSIGLGEDGPTHQPVEQIAGLRSVPNLTTIRPADANETAEAWKAALKHTGGPVALVLSRQNLPVLDRAVYPSADGLQRGAYILADTESGDPEVILIATGAEVHLALAAVEELRKREVQPRVVSMPSWEFFEAQDQGYKDEVLPPHVKARVVIEAASPLGWHKYSGDEGDIIGISTFGASAPAKVIFEKYGFTVENVVKRAMAVVNKRKGLFLDGQ